MNFKDVKRYLNRNITGKDVIIGVLLIVNFYMVSFIMQTGEIINKVNAENERLELENQRMAHLMGLTTEALQKKNKEEAERKLRDPFRPDHPTKEELEAQTKAEILHK